MITFKTGHQVYRQDPGGHETPFMIQDERDVKYHTDLQERGYVYTVVGEADFELPVVESSAPAAPRVHVGGSTCVSCEG